MLIEDYNYEKRHCNCSVYLTNYISVVRNSIRDLYVREWMLVGDIKMRCLPILPSASEPDAHAHLRRISLVDLILAIAESLPEQEWEKVPVDLSARYRDHKRLSENTMQYVSLTIGRLIEILNVVPKDFVIHTFRGDDYFHKAIEEEDVEICSDERIVIITR